MSKPVLAELIPGAVFKGPYPFVRETFESWEGGDGPVNVPTWKPGARFENVSPEDAEAFADGIGWIILEIIDIHKPGRYPTRVFYLRQWQSPDGRIFGKRKLRITTTQAFRALADGYRHDYSVARTP